MNRFAINDKSSCEIDSQELLLAAGEGFEPSQSDPESLVLPLHNPAKNQTVVIITRLLHFFKRKEVEMSITLENVTLKGG
jgi:hypothetical protein